MRQTTRLSAGLAFLLLVAGNLGMAQYPDCNWRCTSGDVTIDAIYVIGPDTCELGETLTASIYADFDNGTNKERYAVRLLADLFIDGSYEMSFDECVAETVPPGLSTVLLTSVSWTCGQSIELRDVIVSWSTSSESCADDPKCSARAAKCSFDVTIAVGGTPLAAGFSSDAPACDGETILFEDSTSGGTPPYSYSWDFGDGAGTSTSDHPSYLYGEPGTYTVILSVTDSAGRVGSASQDVFVSGDPAANASNSGPYCAGDTLSLIHI